MTDIDQLDLLDRLGGDTGLAQELLAIFHEEAPGMLDEVRRAVLGADAEALARAAHNLKGAAANVSATSVQALAEKLEQLGRADDIPPAVATVEQLEAAVARLDEAMSHRA